MSSWQTKASCHVSIFFYLFLLLSQRGCVHTGHCWGTVWHQLPAQTRSAPSRLLLGGLCFLPCRNFMVPGAVEWCPPFPTQVITPLLKLKSGEMLSLHHPKVQLHSSLSQKSLYQDKDIHLQAEDSPSSSHRQGQRMSCPPVKPGTSVAGSDPQTKEEVERAHYRKVWEKEEVGSCPSPDAEKQPLGE